MASSILSRRDLDFLLNEWLQVDRLLNRPRFAAHTSDTLRAALDLAETIAENNFAPHHGLSDREEPSFDGEKVTLPPETKSDLEVFADSGLLAAAMDEQVGGWQLPQVVHRACFAWLQAANI